MEENSKFKLFKAQWMRSSGRRVNYLADRSVKFISFGLRIWRRIFFFFTVFLIHWNLRWILYIWNSNKTEKIPFFHLSAHMEKWKCRIKTRIHIKSQGLYFLKCFSLNVDFWENILENLHLACKSVLYGEFPVRVLLNRVKLALCFDLNIQEIWEMSYSLVICGSSSL